MISWVSPFWLVLLPLVPLGLYLYFRFYKPRGFTLPSLSFMENIPLSFVERLWFLPALLVALSFFFLILALARPALGLHTVYERNQGIAIEMVVDKSSSMGAQIEFQGEMYNRLDVVKHVFKEFLLGNSKQLKGRPNDMVGLISFARYADTIAPLTLSHAVVAELVDLVDLASPQTQEDGTAIGEALALAAARLRTMDEETKEKGNYTIKSKIIILLTDGENNAGSIDPLKAADLAVLWGIKVYTIGFGGQAFFFQQTPFGLRKFALDAGIGSPTLQQIAEKTGARFYEAESAESLQQIYEEIDFLEQSELNNKQITLYNELFWIFAALAWLTLATQILLGATLFRRLA